MLLTREHRVDRPRPIRAGLSVVVVAAVTVGGLVWLVRSDPAAPSRDPAVPHQEVAQPDGEAARSDARPAEPDVIARSGWTTVLVAGASLPVSSQHGPYDLADGRASGFSQDEQGAALAALHVLTRVDPLVGSRVFDATIDEQVTGRRRDVTALRTRTEDRYLGAAAIQQVADGAPLRDDLEVASMGWRAGVDGDEAVVELLFVGPDRQGRPTALEVRVDLDWSDDDWRVVAPPEGRWDAAVAARVPTDYRSWPEVGP